ncbi:MAG: DUF692 family protein [Bacillaceae bacterium]|nr:DUF692 family protein [Bacillaceae bacterium]
MKFAVNYSHQAIDLLVQEAIDVDLIKCPEFDEDFITKVSQHRPVYMHFGLATGLNNIEQYNWNKVKSLKKVTNTPYVNLHLMAFSEDYDGIPVDTTEPKHVRLIKEQVIADVKKIANRFGSENVILENVVYRGSEGHILRPIIDPEIITEIVEETGCGLLLDLAHAQLTTKYLDMDVYDYVSMMPVDHLRELHITGIQHDGNRYRDSMPMTHDDWNLAEWAITNIKRGDWPEPWAVAFEYGGVGSKFEWRSDPKVLAEQVPRLRDLL